MKPGTARGTVIFEKTRTRLYRLSFAINAVVVPGFLTAIALIGATTEPIARWPVELARFFAPGLPANLIAAGLKFPVPTLVLAVVVVAVYWLSRVVKREDDEWAFQTWLYFRPGGPPLHIRPALSVKMIAGIASLWWLWPVLVLLVLVLLPGSLSAESGSDSDKRATMYESPKPVSSCAGAYGPRRLGSGEAALATVAAKRMRNETGLLLAKGETYSARFIEIHGWYDGDYLAAPRGVEFEGWTRYLARGVEWLRPYPEGDWFQLIGRIDHGRDVFPILDQEDPSRYFEFQAPQDGELVLLVNDVLYGNNRGIMTVEIRAGTDDP